MALMTNQQQLPTSHQIAGSRDTPITNLSYIAQSCIIITSIYYNYRHQSYCDKNNTARVRPHSRPGVTS